MPLASGTRLGPYQIVAALGAGGMGEVYRARDTRLDRDVAVKVIGAAGARDASRARRITREAKAMAAISHPNVLAVYDYGEDGDGEPFIVTELVDGPDLRACLEQRGKPGGGLDHLFEAGVGRIRQVVLRRSNRRQGDHQDRCSAEEHHS